MNVSNDERWIEIAKVGRPHGVTGEMRVFPLNPQSEALKEGVQVRWQGKSSHKNLEIETMRPNKKMLLVRVKGLTTREHVAVLCGGMFCVSRSSLADLQDDEFYLSDLIGATIIDEQTGDRLGLVQRIGTNNVEILDIKLDDGPAVLVPFTEQYIGAIDIPQCTVVVRDIDHWLS